MPGYGRSEALETFDQGALVCILSGDVQPLYGRMCGALEAVDFAVVEEDDVVPTPVQRWSFEAVGPALPEVEGLLGAVAGPECAVAA